MASLPALPADKDQIAVGGPGADAGGVVSAEHPIVTAVRRLPARAAAYAPFPDALDARLRQALRARGIEQLYTHQAEAIEHALAGRNVVVMTPTASGKTLCYNAPVLQRDPAGSVERARCICFRPRRWRRISSPSCTSCPSALGASGGEPRSACSPTTATRRRMRGARFAARAHIVLSNPDMVHSGILPHHPRWAKLFENLATSSSTSCTRIAACSAAISCNVLRRLRRICRHYGSNPTFICSSATIANPRELAERLAEQPFELVDESGAPRGEKFFLFVNPPVVNQQLGIRRSYLARNAARRVRVPQAPPAADRLRAEPAVDRDPDDVSEGRFRGRARRRRSGSAAIAAATCRSAAARSRRGCARARCARSCRPTRSSSASTSARSTLPSWPAIRARSPRRGSAPAARAAGAADRRR